MKCKSVVFSTLIVLSVCLAGPDKCLSQTDASVVDRLESMSATEKEKLRYKQARFASLTEAEQQRLRKLHEEIMSHQHSEELIRTMEKYDAWLRTLSASRRAEILALPKEKRLAAIRDEMNKRQRYRFQKWSNLTREDQEHVNRWLDEFAVKNREDLMANGPKELAELAKKLKDDRGSRLFLLGRTLLRNPDKMSAVLQGESFQQVVAKLSDQAKNDYQNAETDDDKSRVAERWIRFGLMSQMQFAKVKEDVLMDFFDSLPADERRQLEMLGRDRMLNELGRLYFGSKIRGFGDYRRHPSRMNRGGRDRRRGPDGGYRSDGDRRPPRPGDRGPGERGPGDRDSGDRGRRPKPPQHENEVEPAE